MCKTQCSGGCEECAPDETSHAEWFTNFNWDRDLDDWEVSQAAYLAGWYKAKLYFRNGQE